MPELPEVYTMAVGLSTLIGKKIKSIWADKPKTLGTVKKIEGRKILGVERRGKNIILNLNKRLVLLVHPKMTGRFLFNKHDKYERVIFNFASGDFLSFSSSLLREL